MSLTLLGLKVQCGHGGNDAGVFITWTVLEFFRIRFLAHRICTLCTVDCLIVKKDCLQLGLCRKHEYARIDVAYPELVVSFFCTFLA